MMASMISFSALAISVGAFWAMVSEKVKDGVIGKIILFFMSISAFAIFARPYGCFSIGQVSESTLLMAFAAYWIRHAWIKLVWHPQIKKYYERNPHRDRRRK